MITGPGNQELEITSTDAEASTTRLMAVTSNDITESQLQFKSKLSLVAPLGGRGILTILEDGRVGVGAPVQGANLTVTGQGNQSIDLVCTGGEPSHIKLLAVNSNQKLEGQNQFLGEFSIGGIPGSASDHGNVLTYRDSGVLLLYRANQQQGIVLDPTQGITFPDGSTQNTATQRGPKGDKGDTGDRGPIGDPGPPGVPGAPGGGASLPSKVVVTVSLGGGAISLLGPAGRSTCGLGSNTIDPNSGVIAVTDAAGAAAGQAAASLSVLDGEGVLTASMKNFRVPHPTQSGMDIVYACIEGSEAAVYARGTARLVNGKGTITLPDHFVSVASAQNMTVQVTPLSSDSLGLSVVTKGMKGIVVMELNRGTGNYDFDWEVKCVRMGHEKYQVIRPRNEMTMPK